MLWFNKSGNIFWFNTSLRLQQIYKFLWFKTINLNNIRIHALNLFFTENSERNNSFVSVTYLNVEFLHHYSNKHYGCIIKQNYWFNDFRIRKRVFFFIFLHLGFRFKKRKINQHLNSILTLFAYSFNNCIQLIQKPRKLSSMFSFNVRKQKWIMYLVMFFFCFNTAIKKDGYIFSPFKVF